MRTPVLLVVILTIVFVACIDMTPSSERDRTIILVPELLRPSMELALSTFADLQASNPYRLVYTSCAEVAHRAGDGEGGLLLTLHPSWADHIGTRRNVLRRQPIATDRLVVAGAPANTIGALADTSGLFEIVGPIGLPSTESASVGMYAREALIRLGIWSRLESRTRAFGTDAAALEAVRNGEIPAAFALASAALEAGLPILLTLDEAFHRPIVVEVLLLTEDPAARNLLDYLVGREGQGAFLAKGFRPANP